MKHDNPIDIIMYMDELKEEVKRSSECFQRQDYKEALEHLDRATWIRRYLEPDSND